MSIPSFPDDLWLEDLRGPASLAWVAERVGRALGRLEAVAGHDEREAQARAILEAPDKLAHGSLHGEFVDNFWQDAHHIRGLWRRTTWEAYVSGTPAWDTLLDVDALARTTGENLVFGGALLRRGDTQRALVVLSEGGSDASQIREYNLDTRQFVDGGFHLPASKSSVEWLTRDDVLLADALTDDTQTESGYPLVVRHWKRGQDASQAAEVFRGRPTDVAVGVRVLHDQGRSWVLLVRELTFFTAEHWLLTEQGPAPLNLPEHALVYGLHRGALVFQTRQPLADADAGSLLAANLDELLSGRPQWQTLLTPSSTQAIESVLLTDRFVVVALLDQVKGRLLRLRRDGQGWTSQVVPLPEAGSLTPLSCDAESDRLLVQYEDFLTPPSLYAVSLASLDLHVVARLPARFDATGLVSHQHWATSADGEKIPYFVVHRADLVADGSHPTLLSGYGGFEIALRPSYLALAGRLWLEHGGLCAVANIRGGGEFGPRWHQAALRDKRPRAFDDFAAVARDLVTRRLTSPRRLGIQGGSNGGLLVGALLTRHPELFSAVVCQVPLLDMLRYHELLAGASWMAEYGNPDDPADRAYLETWSPLHQLRSGTSYPEALFVTSTADDRVHPAHARRMVARLEYLGQSALLFENVEGGHSASADLRQRARRVALEFSYLFDKLTGP